MKAFDLIQKDSNDKKILLSSLTMTCESPIQKTSMKNQVTNRRKVMKKRDNWTWREFAKGRKEDQNRFIILGKNLQSPKVLYRTSIGVKW